jgi:hypothetical protein
MSQRVEYIIALRDKFTKTMRQVDKSTVKTESSMSRLTGVLGSLGLAFGWYIP